MAEFKKYMHVEKFGNDEVQGIELGGCYVFPKLDGTNASVWFDGCGIRCGSRNREISLENDNAGFCKWVFGGSHKLREFFNEFKIVRLYGEWLVPHSLRTYRDDAWERFYIFDVYDDKADIYFDYDSYKPMLEKYDLDFIPPICIMNNATYDNLVVEIGNNGFLIQEGRGCGEGIVIKNYKFQNRFGRVVWAKMVTNEFKEKHARAMGATVKNMKSMPEQIVVDEFVSKHLVDKVYAKIVNEMEGWNSKYIPRLLSTVYYDLVNEEAWNFVKKMKNPTINFKALNTLSIMRVKELKPELF